jgi:hypothetical protein
MRNCSGRCLDRENYTTIIGVVEKRSSMRDFPLLCEDRFKPIATTGGCFVGRARAATTRLANRAVAALVLVASGLVVSDYASDREGSPPVHEQAFSSSP